MYSRFMRDGWERKEITRERDRGALGQYMRKFLGVSSTTSAFKMGRDVFTVPLPFAQSLSGPVK